MIPGQIARFLEQQANIGCAGTRDRNLAPNGHRASGWRVSPDQRTLTVFIAELCDANLVESIADNGEFALTVDEMPTHETYQLKGRAIRHRPLEPGEQEIVDRIRARFIKRVKPIYRDVPDVVIGAFVLPAAMAVEFEVHEVYVQTPGPNAGKRLMPPAEE